MTEPTYNVIEWMLYPKRALEVHARLTEEFKGKALSGGLMMKGAEQEQDDATCSGEATIPRISPRRGYNY